MGEDRQGRGSEGCRALICAKQNKNRMHLRVIDWRGGVFYGAYRDCFGVRVYAVYLFICCAERLPARDTFENAGGCVQGDRLWD